MNIGEIVKNVLGQKKELKSNTVKLKINQIVTGTVLKVLDQEDAIVNINGVHVKAKLKAPLQKGDKTLLQVQKESTSDQIILKPLEQTKKPLTDINIKEILKNFELKNRPGNRQLIEKLHASQIPLQKKNIQQFKNLLNEKPANIPSSEWIETAVTAYQKGLPLTKDTIQSLHSALYSKPFHETLDHLTEELQAFSQTASTEEGNDSHQIISKLAKLIQQIKNESESLFSHSHIDSPNTTAHEHEGTTATPQKNANPARNEHGNQNAIKQDQQESSMMPNQEKQNSTNQVGFQQKLPISHELETQKQAEQRNQSGNSSKIKSETNLIPNKDALQGKQPIHGKEPSPNNQQQPAELNHLSTQENGNKPNIVQLLKQLGMQHENEIMKNAESPITDNLKSALLQLQNHDHLPPSLKETVQQVVQQLTGHQLLNTPQQQQSFIGLTMFIPIFHKNGNQTATIHVQSRKNKKGGIDGSNCRLMFNLNMQMMGDTLLDVQVMDRRVSIHVYNDLPAVSTLILKNQKEIEKQLQEVGYQLLSIKNSTFLKSEKNTPSSMASGPLWSEEYQGLDVRI